MLKISLPPNEKSPVVSKLFPVNSYPQLTQPGTSVVVSKGKWGELAAMRQQIIQKAVDECPFKVGDEVKCYTFEAQELHGKDVVINKIVTSYAQIRNDKWPESNVPMIIHAYSRDKDMHYVCTAGYLIAKDAKESA